jgi:hypothetical protein
MAAAASKIQNPEFYLLKMSVTTSSSRFRNTGDVVGKLTWLELSQLRAEVARNYTIQAFQQAGIIVGASPNGKYNTEYIINPKGQNGDGSSGPNPPSGFAFNTDGRGTWQCGQSMNDSDKPQVCTYKNRGDFGQTIADKRAYDQFKYLILTCDLVMKNTFQKPDDQTTPPTPGKEIKGNVYSIEFYRKQKGVKIPYWYPTIDVNFGKLNLDNGWNKFVNRVTPGAHVEQRTIKCFFK